jgi:hypothetical protein
MDANTRLPQLRGIVLESLASALLDDLQRDPLAQHLQALHARRSLDSSRYVAHACGMGNWPDKRPPATGELKEIPGGRCQAGFRRVLHCLRLAATCSSLLPSLPRPFQSLSTTLQDAGERTQHTAHMIPPLFPAAAPCIRPRPGWAALMSDGGWLMPFPRNSASS